MPHIPRLGLCLQPLCKGREEATPLLPPPTPPRLSQRWGQTHQLLPLTATLSVTLPSAPSPASLSCIPFVPDPLSPTSLSPASPLLPSLSPASSFPPALWEPWLNLRLLEQKQTCPLMPGFL